MIKLTSGVVISNNTPAPIAYTIIRKSNSKVLVQHLLNTNDADLHELFPGDYVLDVFYGGLEEEQR